jgi:CubicO group peptidase (beta-lactamase class C family)
METTPRDLARVGQLMLDGGRWHGKQVVPEAWVRASVQPSQRVNPEYGLLWWLDVPGGFASRGYLNTSMYVFPARELVVVRMQARPVPGAADYERTALGLFARMTRR